MRLRPETPTYGAEEEVWVVDRLSLSPAVPEAECLAELSRRLGPRMTREYKAAVIELVTGVHTTPEALTEEVAANRHEAGEVLTRFGYAALPLATHPVADPLAMPAREGERYRRIEQQKGFAVKGLGANGVHLHIGTYAGDAERTRHLPTLMHLAAVHAGVTASSPFVNGRDTGQASWRLRILMQLASPLPLVASDAGELARIYGALAAAGGPKDASEQWGFVRLGAGKPTIEFRAADTLPTLDHLPWLAALTGAAAHAARRGQLPPLALSESASAYLYTANLDRVAAEGADAVLVDPFDLQARTVHATIETWIERVAPSIDALGLGDAIGLRPTTLPNPWRDMKRLADEDGAEALRRGLDAVGAQGLALRRTIERALQDAASIPQMPWLRQARVA
jgi:carboxylate-amine ligase